MDVRHDEHERIRQLIEENRQQAAQLQRQAAQIQELEAELKRLRQLLEGKAESKAAKKPVFKENYSLDRNEHRKKRKRRGKASTGRRPKEQKREIIASHCDVYPPNADRKACVLHREQFAWRLINGRAVYVRYRIYDLPGSKHLPLPPGLRTSRSEYGIEIILILAFLHYWIGISLDHACTVMQFFTKLELPKSQADSLLKQLAGDWDEQYDTIAELIALQMIVYIDETGWKVGTKSCYTWVFSTALHVLFRCGVSRSKTEAQAVLGDSFAGIGVTDDYAAYKDLFTQHQLCWAHLIRKAIKLALQYPDHREYAAFLDELCEIYREAIRHQNDGRLSVGRAEKVEQLLDRLRQLCTRHGEPIVKDETPPHLADFIRLQNELMDNPNCLFVFVTNPAVEATNNRSERNVRREAEIRKGARTSKTADGAHRRSVILTVLASLATRFQRFTLDNLLSEVTRWWETGQSIFERELARLLQPNAPPACSAET
jgi:transposase